MNIGLVPDGGSSFLIPERIGFARAAEMAMLGERVPAAQALEWGLINRVVADSELTARGRRARRPPGRRARRAPTPATKRQLNAWQFSRMAAQLELEATIQQEMVGTDDFVEGVTAFVQKRASALSKVGDRDREGVAVVLILPALVPEGRLRRLLLALPLALAAALFAAPAASAGLLFPEAGGSPNADSIKTLYIMVFVLALFIFAGVEGALIWALVKFRARKGRTAAQIHGNTKLEIGWTVGAAVILVFITAFTFIKLGDIKDPMPSRRRATAARSRSPTAPSSPRPTSSRSKARR